MRLFNAEQQAPAAPRNGITPEVALHRRIRKRRSQPTRLVGNDSHKVNLPDRSSKRHKLETKKHAGITHGASDVDQRPMFEGLWATAMTYTPAAYLRPMVLTSKKMMKQVIPFITHKAIKDYEASLENKIRSINVMYSGGLMSKGKYKAVCLSLAFKPKKGGEKRRRTKLTLGENGFQVPALVRYDQLIKFINNIDMVALKDIKDFCDDLDIDDDDKLVSGRYGELGELGDILIRLASMNIKLEREMLSIFYGWD